MPRQLSERETAALRSIEKHTTGPGSSGPGATRDELHLDMSAAGFALTLLGVQRTAESLARKGLAWRTDPLIFQWRVTQTGLEALRGAGARAARGAEPAPPLPARSFTLDVPEAAELLIDLGMLPDDAVYALGQAVECGAQRAQAGKWHLQIDHAESDPPSREDRFTVTVHARRTAPEATR